MRLFEYEAKKIFQKNGIDVPKQYGIINSSNEIKDLDIEFPVMLKANVLTGGRGKAGGVKKAKTPEEAFELSEKILSLKIRGYPVESLLLEEALPQDKQLDLFYISATMNPKNYNNVVIVSPDGGVDIEEIAKTSPDRIKRKELTRNEDFFLNSIAEELTSFLEKASKKSFDKKQLSDLISTVYNIYQKYDCKLVEINPLIITPDGAIATDAKIVLDDNALYRQVELLRTLDIEVKRHDIAEPTSNEARAIKAEFPYIDLLSEGIEKEQDKFYVGLVPGGAGYGIFSIDETVNVGKKHFNGKVVPVNFMDSGGGPSKEKVAEMFNLLMDYKFAGGEHLDLIITSRFGGVSSCDVFIKGLIHCLIERYKNGTHIVPVYGRMVGTDLPSARTYLEKAKRDTPDALSKLDIIVGNREIMADVITKGIEKYYKK